MKISGTKTLYEVLAAPSPEGVAAGETNRTLSKDARRRRRGAAGGGGDQWLIPPRL
jgi:hypothetical protein